MRIRALPGSLLLVVALAAPAAGQPRTVAQLRPIDRATVRILTSYGIQLVQAPGARTTVPRTWAAFQWGHGSGLLVQSDGLILTARHVVENADFVAVRVPGSDEPLPAKVVYVDWEHDLAFLRVPGPIDGAFGLPNRAPALETGERLSASGYPVDASARTPAAISGELSRITEEGLVQVAMPINAGNSGGPVIDERGNLVGIVSMRGRVEEGVQGIGFLEPTAAILAARAGMGRRLPPDPVDPVQASLARFFVSALEQDVSRPSPGLVGAREVADAAARATSPEAQAIVAAWGWNLLLHMLEELRVRDLGALPPDLRNTAEGLRGVAVGAAQRALASAPYLPRRYSFLSLLVRSNGREFALERR